MSDDIKQKETPAADDAHAVRADETKTDAPSPAAPAADGQAAVRRNKYADKMNKKKSRFGKGMRIGAAVTGAALLIGLGVFLVMRSRGAGTAENAANTTAVAMRGMLETYIEGDGTTAAKKREEVGKDLKGKVSEVAVEVGQTVKKGDKLLVVNPTDTRKELTTTEEELADAQRGVTDAQNSVSKAQTAVGSAQKKLGKTTVAAPFTGKIVPEVDAEGAAKEFTVGQQITAGTTIGSMVDDSSMKLALYFSYAYVDDIKAGQKATVSIPSAMSEVEGTVDSVEQVQKISEDGVKLFRVAVSMKNPGTLIKGMTATATVTAAGSELFPAESGTLEYNREEAVTAQVTGEITSVSGTDYYNYNSGAAIMRISSDEAQDELKNAQNEVTGARNEVTRAQKLVQTKQERIAELKKLIANATVKSPIDGVVVSVNAVADQEVSGAEALCVVADLEDIIVNANITSTDVMAVQPGQPATMTMYTMDGETMLTGTVESVAMEPSQNANGGQGSMPTFPAVIAIDPMGEGQTLSIGQGVNFKITTASSMDCLIVPSGAVVNTEEGTAVFAKPPEGGSFENALPLPEGTEGVPPDFVLVPVEVGIADAANTEILWGIDEGTTVYLAGPEDVYADMGEGMAVAVG